MHSFKIFDISSKYHNVPEVMDTRLVFVWQSRVIVQ